MRLSLALLGALTGLADLALGHFKIDSPAQRDISEDDEVNFPCGGAPVSKTRTSVPLDLGPIQLDMEHDRVSLQVLLAMGNDPGDAFNTVILPTITQEGIGMFCIGSVTIPSSLNITNGMNATIQVVTSSETGSGGLYSCADITFSSSAQPGKCNNDTGVMTAPYSGPANANGTGSSSSMTMSGSSTATGTATGASATSSAAAVPAIPTGGAHALGALALGALGAAALL